VLPVILHGSGGGRRGGCTFEKPTSNQDFSVPSNFDVVTPIQKFACCHAGLSCREIIKYESWWLATSDIRSSFSCIR